MCDQKAIILFLATMAIEKHLNITYVARSEETSWEWDIDRVKWPK